MWGHSLFKPRTGLINADSSCPVSSCAFVVVDDDDDTSCCVRDKHVCSHSVLVKVLRNLLFPEFVGRSCSAVRITQYTLLGLSKGRASSSQ